MVTSKNKQGKLNLIVNGDTLLQTSGTMQLISGKNIKVAYQDQNGESSVEIEKDQVNISSTGKIVMNGGDEPILLGSKTVSLLSDLLQTLSTETAGPYPLAHAAFYAQLKEQLDTLKSQLAFLK